MRWRTLGDEFSMSHFSVFKTKSLFKIKLPYTYLTQRNGPLSARGKSFCENPLDAKRISFGIKYIALEAKKKILFVK